VGRFFCKGVFGGCEVLICPAWSLSTRPRPPVCRCVFWIVSWCCERDIGSFALASLVIRLVLSWEGLGGSLSLCIGSVVLGGGLVPLWSVLSDFFVLV